MSLSFVANQPFDVIFWENEDMHRAYPLYPGHYFRIHKVMVTSGGILYHFPMTHQQHHMPVGK